MQWLYHFLAYRYRLFFVLGHCDVLAQSLETDLLVEHIVRLKAGEAVDVPRYDFSSHSRCLETTRQAPRRIILVEGESGHTPYCTWDRLLQHLLTGMLVCFLGILIFCNRDLTSQFDLKIFVDAPADIRLMRRIRRDCEERGRTPSDVLEQYHATVRPMHEEFVEPSKVHADLIVPNAGSSGLEGRNTRPLDKAVQVVSNHARAMLI